MHDHGGHEHTDFDEFYAAGHRWSGNPNEALIREAGELSPGRVLDIGCGEGAWRGPLLKLRPKVAYLGFDSSQYAIERHGARRNLHWARFADFEHLRPCPPADLVICADVLHYLPAREIDRGLAGLAELCGGVAFLETFTRQDETVGDEDGFLRRPAAFYRGRFQSVGLRPLGSHCWLSPALADGATALELVD